MDHLYVKDLLCSINIKIYGDFVACVNDVAYMLCYVSLQPSLCGVMFHHVCAKSKC